MYRFLVLERNLVMREVVAAGDEIWIGRTRTFPVALRDRCVSRRHAVARLREDGLYLEDQQSRTGTFVNGTRVLPGTSVRLKDGDVIACGASSVVIRVEVAPESPGPGGAPEGFNPERINARLVVVAGGEIRAWQISRPLVVLGRSSACDIRIPSDDVAPEHARILFAFRSFYLENRSAGHGVLVNGSPTNVVRLSTNSAISLGSSQLLFLYDREADGSLAWDPIEAIPGGRFLRYFTRAARISAGQAREIRRARPSLNVQIGEIAVRRGLVGPGLWRSICTAAARECGRARSLRARLLCWFPRRSHA